MTSYSFHIYGNCFRATARVFLSYVAQCKISRGVYPEDVEALEMTNTPFVDCDTDSYAGKNETKSHDDPD